MTDLIFRRQFYLASRHPSELAGWRQLNIGPTWKLSVHPDLEVEQFQDAEGSITLLGYAFDGAQPQARAADILQQLWRWRSDPQKLRRDTDRLGGRWVLIVQHAGQTWLCPDATAARQVSHAVLNGEVVCASQAALIAELHGLPVDPAAQAFVRARGDSDLDVYWLPGNRTLYQAVRVLLPNHVLDLQTGQVQREWLSGPIGRGDLGAVVQRSVATMGGYIEAARRRGGGLAVPMTAGWDSRLVLAMTRPDAADLYCYTLIYPNQSRSNRDVAVPARLLRKLGIKHLVIDYPRVIDAQFRALCQRNAYNGHEAYCADSQVLHELYPQSRLCLTGDVAEIVKCHYRLPGHAGPVMPADLARLCGLPEQHPFALAALQDWLDGVPADHPVPLLDLLCWEQMAGRWQAMIRAEYDVVQESFAPLNSRALLVDMLSLDEKLRCRPDFVLFGELIKSFWPDTLSEPINPPERESLRFRAVRMIGRLKLQRLIPSALKDRLRRAVL